MSLRRVIGLLTLSWLGACGGTTRAPSAPRPTSAPTPKVGGSPTDTAPAHPGPAANLVGSGTLMPRVTVTVSSVTSGRVVEIFVDFNSVVKKGQVLARLEPASRSARDVASATILAPIDGVVLARDVEVGQVVMAGTPPASLFTLGGDLSQLVIDAVMAPTAAARARPGMPAAFTVDAYPGQRFAGVVRQLGAASDHWLIDVDNRDLRLRPGMTANVVITP